jgi:hypothetical protein|tara:strand:+ start:432 stop:779 length:348 start_codon:yes stop_codon:yes gene_type:complete
MNKEELLAYADEHGAGSYESSWEKEEWFKLLTSDKDVVMAMVEMSESQCLLHGPLSNSDWKKDKDIVLRAIEIYRNLWEGDDEDADGYEAAELWDLVDESLRTDPDIINEIGEEF